MWQGGKGDVSHAVCLLDVHYHFSYLFQKIQGFGIMMINDTVMVLYHDDSHCSIFNLTLMASLSLFSFFSHCLFSFLSCFFSGYLLFMVNVFIVLLAATKAECCCCPSKSMLAKETSVLRGTNLNEYGSNQGKTRSFHCFTFSIRLKFHGFHFEFCEIAVLVHHQNASDLSFCHHVFIRLQVESKGFPHLSDSIEQHFHLHHVLLIPLFELNV